MFRHFRTVSLLTLASRLTGLIRDASFSRVFGTTPLMDAFLFAFMIPNLFRRLFGEGALAAAFLPVFSRLDRDDPAMARRLASIIIATLVTGLGGVVLAGEIVLFAISSAGGHENLAVWLMMITLPYMPMVCTVAMLGAMLQVRGRFGPTAAAPIVLNLCLIGATLGLPWLVHSEASDAERFRLAHIGVVAAAVVLAGVLQIAWSLFALRDRPWWIRDRAAGRTAAARVLRQALPMVVGLGVLQLNTFFDGVIASYRTAVGPTIAGLEYPLETGAMAAVSFAQRLYQFPLGVFGIAIATAVFPALARVARDDEVAFLDTVRRGIRLVIFIGLPASVGLMLVQRHLTTVVLEGGTFTADDTARVGRILLGYAPAVWAYSMTHVLTRAFYARGESMAPVKVAIAVVALNVTLNCTLIWTPLREAGLAWSTAICAVIQVIALALLLRRRLGPLAEAGVRASWVKTAIATAVMTAALLGAGSILPEAETWRGALLALAGLVSLGVVAYVAATATMRMPELRWAIGREA